MIYIGQETKERISTNVISAFPDVNTGFLFGTEDADGNRTITDVLSINTDGEPFINQSHIQQATEYGRNHELKLVGIYRSHASNQSMLSPDERIADNADFTYLLLALSEAQIGSMRAWRFKDEQIIEELISDKPLA